VGKVAGLGVVEGTCSVFLGLPLPRATGAVAGAGTGAGAGAGDGFFVGASTLTFEEKTPVV
jgi:hypothetical protein